MGRFLLVIGEREALAWILRTQQMAFPGRTRREVSQLMVGDTLYLTTTRGCFHNPTRDRTRIIGRAQVTSPVVPLDPPVEVAGRVFPTGCRIALGSLAGYREGVDLADLAPKLEAFPRPEVWAAWLRRPLVQVTDADAALIEDRLAGCTGPAGEQVPEYLTRIRPLPASRHRQKPAG